MLQIEKAATLLVEDPEGEKRLVAFVAPTGLDLNELENKMRDNVPSFLVPHLFQQLPSLPLTPHGEVQFCTLYPHCLILTAPD